MRRGVSLYSELWTTWLSDSGATNFKVYYGSWEGADTLWERNHEWKSQKNKIKIPLFSLFFQLWKRSWHTKSPQIYFFLYHVETTLLLLNSISPPLSFFFSKWQFVPGFQLVLGLGKQHLLNELGGKIAEKKNQTQTLCLKCIISLFNCVTCNRNLHYFPVFFTCEYVLWWKQYYRIQLYIGYNICGCLEI